MSLCHLSRDVTIVHVLPTESVHVLYVYAAAASRIPIPRLQLLHGDEVLNLNWQSVESAGVADGTSLSLLEVRSPVLLTAHSDGICKLWATSSGACVLVLSGRAVVKSAAISADGRGVLKVGSDYLATLCDTTKGGRIANISIDVLCAPFSIHQGLAHVGASHT